MSRARARRGRWPWLLMALGLPLAAPGLLLSPNEYAAWGGAGVDCDGPFVLAFALPAAALYLACAIALGLQAVRGRRGWVALAALACLLLALALGANVRAALAEAQRAEHRASCG